MAVIRNVMNYKDISAKILWHAATEGGEGVLAEAKREAV